MKTITIKAEEMLVDNNGFYIVACDGQNYKMKRCHCKRCHHIERGE